MIFLTWFFSDKPTTFLQKHLALSLNYAKLFKTKRIVHLPFTNLSELLEFSVNRRLIRSSWQISVEFLIDENGIMIVHFPFQGEQTKH